MLLHSQHICLQLTQASVMTRQLIYCRMRATWQVFTRYWLDAVRHQPNIMIRQADTPLAPLSKGPFPWQSQIAGMCGFSSSSKALIATSLMTRNACCAADTEHVLVAVMNMYGLTSKPGIYMLTRMILTRMLTRMMLTRIVLTGMI